MFRFAESDSECSQTYRNVSWTMSSAASVFTIELASTSMKDDTAGTSCGTPLCCRPSVLSKYQLLYPFIKKI